MAFLRNCLVKTTLDTVSATFSCYEHGANASEAVQKIATNQKSIANAPHVL